MVLPAEQNWLSSFHGWYGGGCHVQGPPASDVTAILVTVLVCDFDGLAVCVLLGLEFAKWTSLASASTS